MNQSETSLQPSKHVKYEMFIPLFTEWGEKQQERLRIYTITVRGIHVTTAAMEKQQILHILNVFIALLFKQVKCMPHIIMSPAACPAVVYFSHYLINGTI